MSDFGQHHRGIVERFLRTAAVVDDRAYTDINPITTSIVTPSRSSLSASGDYEPAPRDVRRDLNTEVLVRSFSTYGIVCGVVTPGVQGPEDRKERQHIVEVGRFADIVILDWHMAGDEIPGQVATRILLDILRADDDGRLRLVTVYTGETDLISIVLSILHDIRKELNREDYEVRANFANLVVECKRYCRIVVYAKTGTALPAHLEDKSVGEEALVEQVLGDFAGMTEGLLPSLALTSLTAVRDNTHRILTNLDGALDPAFLTHRACLPVPSDAANLVISQISAEIDGIITDAVSKYKPADINAIRAWLVTKHGNDKTYSLQFGDQSEDLSVDDVVALLKCGVDNMSSVLSNKQRRDLFGVLSAVLADADQLEEMSAEMIDKRFAWLVAHRVVVGDSPRILQLGSIVCNRGSEQGEFLVCIRPKCDCVRLTEPTAFLFLPLVKTDRTGAPQIVVRTGKRERVRMRVLMRPILYDFAPTGDRVEFTKNGDGEYSVNDEMDSKFEWLGELNADYAQGLAHGFGSQLSRVGVDNSEWLRRKERG